MYKLWKTVIGALLLSVVASSTFAGELTSQCTYLDFSGEVLDTDLGVSFYHEGQHKLDLVIDGLTIKIDSYQNVTDEPTPPFCVGYLEKKKNKITAKANANVDGDDVSLARARECLSNHRKLAGFGVHGPLKIKGTLILQMSWKDDKPVKVTPIISFTELSGPKGSWIKE